MKQIIFIVIVFVLVALVVTRCNQKSKTLNNKKQKSSCLTTDSTTPLATQAPLATHYIGDIAFQVDENNNFDVFLVGTAIDEKTGETGILYVKTIYCQGHIYDGMFFEKDLVDIRLQNKPDSLSKEISKRIKLFGKKLIHAKHQ